MRFYQRFKQKIASDNSHIKSNSDKENSNKENSDKDNFSFETPIKKLPQNIKNFSDAIVSNSQKIHCTTKIYKSFRYKFHNIMFIFRVLASKKFYI